MDSWQGGTTVRLVYCAAERASLRAFRDGSDDLRKQAAERQPVVDDAYASDVQNDRARRIHVPGQSLALEQGIELRTIKEILGHSQISTAANPYAQVLPVLQRQASERMEALLSGTP